MPTTEAEQYEIGQWVKESRKVWRRVREIKPPTEVVVEAVAPKRRRRSPKLNPERSALMGRPRVGKYLGVSSVDKGSRFRASICIGKGQVLFLGKFATDIEAARAFDAKALELRGPTANLNFPLEHKELS